MLLPPVAWLHVTHVAEEVPTVMGTRREVPTVVLFLAVATPIRARTGGAHTLLRVECAVRGGRIILYQGSQLSEI